MQFLYKIYKQKWGITGKLASWINLLATTCSGKTLIDNFKQVFVFQSSCYSFLIIQLLVDCILRLMCSLAYFDIHLFDLSDPHISHDQVTTYLESLWQAAQQAYTNT